MEKNYWPQNEILTRRILSDKPCRLDALIFWAQCGHRKIRASQLARIVREA